MSRLLYEFSFLDSIITRQLFNRIVLHDHRTWPMRCKEVKAREEPDVDYCHSAMIYDKVMNASASLSIDAPSRLFSIAGHCGHLSCAALSPMLSITTRDFVQVSHDHAVFCSIDDNNDGANQFFSFCFTRWEDPVVAPRRAKSFRPCY